jgi:hypothetical protein
VPVALTAVLCVFWAALACREFQRGDLLLATVVLAVGVVLTIYRPRPAKKEARPSRRSGALTALRAQRVFMAGLTAPGGRLGRR